MKLHSFWIFALIYITLINGERCPDADAKGKQILSFALIDFWSATLAIKS